MSTPRGEKLPSLTSLRFVAAATVVLFHTYAAFGIAGRRWEVGGLQAVSFFFLLSGFINYHVYPTLDSWKSRGRFLLARFARIYPAHLASLALLFVLVPWLGEHALNQPLVLAAHLTLLQSWLPQSRYCFALNNPAWSISTEAFFYACFPLLVLSWRRTWPVKLALACTLLLALIC